MWVGVDIHAGDVDCSREQVAASRALGLHCTNVSRFAPGNAIRNQMPWEYHFTAVHEAGFFPFYAEGVLTGQIGR